MAVALHSSSFGCWLCFPGGWLRFVLLQEHPESTIIEPISCFQALDADTRLNFDSMAVALHSSSFVGWLCFPGGWLRFVLLQEHPESTVIEPIACFQALDADTRLNFDSMAVALHIGSFGGWLCFPGGWLRFVLLQEHPESTVIEPIACFQALDADTRLNFDSMAVALHIGSFQALE